MGRSPGFGSVARDLSPFRTRFRSGSGCPCLNLATHEPLVGSFYKRHAVTPTRLLRPAGSARFQDLFHSPRRGAFHRSLTVLVHYRSLAVFSLGPWSPLLPTGFRVSGGTHDHRITQLGPAVAYGTLTLSGRPFQRRSADQIDPSEGSAAPSIASRSTPHEQRRQARTPHAVWAPPRSLAATTGILSFPRGTEMFQFPRFPPASIRMYRPFARRVAPFGDPWITGCQRLPRAFRRVAASFIGRQRQGIHHAPIFADLATLMPLHSQPGLVPRRHMTRPRSRAMDRLDQRLTMLVSRRSRSGPCRRSGVSVIATGSVTLCPISSCPDALIVKVRACQVEPRGLEPRTSAVQGRRSPS